jgi:hypothetical protein
LAAGSYALSLYYYVPAHYFGWVQTLVTEHGRGVQTIDYAGTLIGGGGNGVDMTFRIIGTAVPEPGLGITLGLAIALALGCRRR